MGLPSLRHPRLPTTLCRLTLVLGLQTYGADRQRRSLGQACHLRTSSDRHHHSYRRLTLDRRNSLILRSSGVLPSSAGPDSEFLQISHAPQGRALVLRRRPHPKLLPIRAVRP